MTSDRKLQKEINSRSDNGFLISAFFNCKSIFFLTNHISPFAKKNVDLRLKRIYVYEFNKHLSENFRLVVILKVKLQKFPEVPF